MNLVKRLFKWLVYDRLNTHELIRCCARCEYVFFKWNQHKEMGGCPQCGFAHYGARYVYGDYSFLFVFLKALLYPKKSRHPYPTFVKIYSCVCKLLSRRLNEIEDEDELLESDYTDY